MSSSGTSIKKIMIKTAGITILFIALFLAANKFLCTHPGSPPEIIDVTSIKILDLNPDSLKLLVTVLAVNKNNYDININRLNLKLIIEGDTLGKAESNEYVEIAPEDTVCFSFNADLNTMKSVRLGSGINDSVEIRLLGGAVANLGLISLPVDIDINYKLNFKEKIREVIENDTEANEVIKIKAARFKPIKLNESAIEVDFTINNPYGIDFVLEGYPSAISINGSIAGTGNLDGAVNVFKKGSVSNGTAQYVLSNTGTVASLIKSFLKKELVYETNGTLQIDILGYKVNLPYSFKGELIKL